MKAKPIELVRANEFVATWHRHHKPVIGHKFSIAAVDDNGWILGVAIVGRPVARGLDKPGHFEVTRLCTAGGKNVCSFLYAAAAKEVRKRGGKWVFTYILETEKGTSLKAAGWIRTKLTKGGTWNTPSRPRTDKAPICRKWRYEKYFHVSPEKQ